jgi:hypothetical protein
MDKVLEEIENAEKNGISLDDIITALNDKRNKDKKKAYLLSVQKKREELINEIAYGIAYELNGPFNVENVNEIFYIIYSRTLNQITNPVEIGSIVWKESPEYKINFIDDDFKCQKCCRKYSSTIPIYYNMITKEIYCGYDRDRMDVEKYCENICTYLPELIDIVKTNLIHLVNNGYKTMDIRVHQIKK